MPRPLIQERPATGPGGPRDREAYFVAAYELLAEGGCEAVTLAALCRRLHATTGSFYHHFADMPAFVTAFADRWRQGVATWIAECLAIPDPVRRHEVITNEGLDYLFTAGESAVRAWAQTEPALQSALMLVHLSGHEVSIRTYEEILGDPDLAGVLQGLAMCTTLGLSLRAEGSVDPDRYLRMVQDFGRRSVGIETELVEIDGRLRFRFLDGVKADLRANPPWKRPDVRRLRWVNDALWPPAVEPGTDGRSRSREDYFAVARELLARHGSDGVAVSGLCQQLGVTKGSFRWHFGNMPGFVDALLAHWEHSHDQRLRPAVGEPDPVARLEQLLRLLLVTPDPADNALRAWGHTAPAVGDALRRIDRRRWDAFASAILAVTADPGAELLADGMLGLAIGLHQSQLGVDPTTAALIVLAFARRYLRIDANLSAADGLPVFTVRRG